MIRDLFVRREGWAFMAACALASLSAPASGESPLHGDLLAVSRNRGTMLVVDPAAGTLRGVLTGPDLRQSSAPVVGIGAPYWSSFHSGLRSINGVPLVRYNISGANRGLCTVDPANGNRVILPLGAFPAWDQSGDIVSWRGSVLVGTGDNFTAQLGSRGKVFFHELATNTTTQFSGNGLGDGPELFVPRAITRINDTTVAVVEWKAPVAQNLGAGVYLVDTTTGDRKLLSRLTSGTFTRSLVQNGIIVGTVTLGDDEGGSGPVTDLQARTVALLDDGDLLVGFAIQRPDDTFSGGFFRVDIDTGDRTLIVGEAYADGPVPVTLVGKEPSSGVESVDGPMGLTRLDDGRWAYVTLFDSRARVWALDAATGDIALVADVHGALHPNQDDPPQLSGLDVYREPCPGDANGDRVVDFADLNDVFETWGATGLGAAGGDVSPAPFGDGVVNFADLNALLNAWGATCP